MVSATLLQGSQQALSREAQPARPVRQAPPRETGRRGGETPGQGLHWRRSLESCDPAEGDHLDSGHIDAAATDQKCQCGSVCFDVLGAYSFLVVNRQDAPGFSVVVVGDISILVPLRTAD